MTDIQANFVAANDIRLHFLRGGHGPTLMLLHGWPEWSYVWRPLIKRLHPDFDLVAPDFRGFGDSEKTSLSPTRDATPETLAADTLAIADALGLGQIGLVAHDVGGFVAQVIARRWPERKDAFDDELEIWVDNFLKPGNLQGGLNWYLSNHASRMAVIEGTAPPPAPIHIPTRVFWGEHDPLFRKIWTDRLSEFFTDLEFSFAPGAGHFVHYETPDQAAEEIRRFFGRISMGRGVT